MVWYLVTHKENLPSTLYLYQFYDEPLLTKWIKLGRIGLYWTHMNQNLV
jgi:hypothetical protein